MIYLVPKRLTALLMQTMCIGLFLFYGVAGAAEPKLEAPSNLIVSQGLQVVLALAVTLATIWGLSRVALKKSWHRSFKEQKIKVLDSVALGSRERVLLVEIGNQQVLIGSTPGQLRSLHAFQKDTDEVFSETLKKAESANFESLETNERRDVQAGAGRPLKGNAQ